MLYLLKTLFVIDVLMTLGLLLFRWALGPRGRDVVPGKLFALALLTPAVALFCGNIYLFCLYLAVVVAFNSRSRTELAGTYLFLLPLMPLLTVQAGVGGIYLLGISAVIALGMGALLGFAVTGGRTAPALPRYDLAAWAVVGLFVFMYNRDLSPTGLLRGLAANALGFIAPYLLVSRGARSAADVERLLLRLCLGGTLMAVTACYQARTRWVLFEAYYQTLHVPVPLTSASLALRAGLLRTGGSMVDYSSAGLFLASVLTLLPLLRHHFRAAGFWAVVAVLVGALFVTQSRGAWVAAIVGLVFVAACRGKWGRVLLLAGGAVAAEAAILVFAKSGTLAQIAGRTEEAGGNVDYRRLLLSRGMDQIRSHPLLGQSPEQLIANMPDLRQGEHIVDFVNTHLLVAMAGGIPLFIIWCLVWSMPVVEGWRRRGSGYGLLAIAPAAIIVPAMVALAFTSPGDRNLTWPIVALGLMVPCLAISRRARPGGARPAAPAVFAPVPAPVLVPVAPVLAYRR